MQQVVQKESRKAVQTIYVKKKKVSIIDRKIKKNICEYLCDQLRI